MTLTPGKIYRVRLTKHEHTFAAKYQGVDRRNRLIFESSNGITSWHKESDIEYIESL